MQMESYLAKFFLLFSSEPVLMPLIFIGLILRQQKFLNAAMLLFLTIILSALLKLTFAIPFSAETIARHNEQGFAFPSGHTQATAVFYGWLLLEVTNRYLKLFLAIIIAGVGFGLIEQGYHNFNDVLGGLFFAGLTIVCYKIILWIVKNYSDFSPQKTGVLIIFFAIAGLVIIIPNDDLVALPHTATAFYSAAGLTLAYLISQKLPTKIRTFHLVLIVAAFVSAVVLILASNSDILLVMQTTWLFIAAIPPFLAVIARRFKIAD
jgi:hypothetical protein